MKTQPCVVLERNLCLNSATGQLTITIPRTILGGFNKGIKGLPKQPEPKQVKILIKEVIWEETQ